MSPRSGDASLKAVRSILSATHSTPRTFVSSRSLCLECRFRSLELRSSTASRHTRQLPLLQFDRPFSSAVRLSKKSSASSKSARKSPDVSPPPKSKHVPDNAATKERDADIDPYDFRELNEGIATAHARLKDALIKTRDAGRVTPQMLESLQVEVNVKGRETHGGKAHHEKMKLGDMASVVQKGGRMLQVYCAEEAHIKPISSAIQSSPHSLVPQPDSTNPLLLLVPVPPATAETRAQARAEAKKVYDRTTLEIRNLRGDAQKRHRKMELGKLVIVDELKKAHKQMEEVVRKGQDEAKKIYEAALKALDG